MPGTATAKRRVLLVDDHQLLRRGLARLIDGEADFNVCCVADSCPGAIAAIEKSLPDLVLTDLDLHDSDGLTLLRHLRRHYPDLPVLVLSMHDESSHASDALSAGAWGYLEKQEITDTLLFAMRRVLTRQRLDTD